MKVATSFLLFSLLCFLGALGYVIYALYEPHLPNVYWPIQLKADGSKHEFTYTPKWAMLRRQTVEMAVETDAYLKWEKSEGFPEIYCSNLAAVPNKDDFPMLRVQIFLDEKKQFDQDFSFSRCWSSSYIKTPNNQKIKVKRFTGWLVGEVQGNDDRFFEFKPHQQYHVVITDLSKNLNLRNVPWYWGFARASSFRKIKIPQ